MSGFLINLVIIYGKHPFRLDSSLKIGLGVTYWASSTPQTMYKTWVKKLGSGQLIFENCSGGLPFAIMSCPTRCDRP